MQSLVLLHLFACGYYLIASFQGTSYVEVSFSPPNGMKWRRKEVDGSERIQLSKVRKTIDYL